MSKSNDQAATNAAFSLMLSHLFALHAAGAPEPGPWLDGQQAGLTGLIDRTLNMEGPELDVAATREKADAVVLEVLNGARGLHRLLPDAEPKS